MKGKFKESDVGLIPEDWELKKIGEVGKFSKGQGVKKDESSSGDLPCIRYGEIYTKHNDFIKEFYSFISPSIALTAKKIFQGDILFAGSGETKEEIGKCVAFINSFVAYAGGDIVILSPQNSNSTFLGYLLNAPLIQNQKASRGQGDAVVHISASQLSQIVIPLPPTLVEQEAITTVLSDTDAWIASLEAQIAKKKLIKQGTMQELLTGKRRLPGFGAGKGWKDSEVGRIPEDWEVKKLGDVVTFLDGRRKPIKDSDRDKMRGDFPYYGASGIIDYVNRYLFDEDLILLGEDGDNILSRNTKLAFKVNGKIWVNNHAHVLRPNAEFNLDFLVELLESLDYELYNSGTAQPKLNQKTCKLIPIPLPPTLAEQDAIALILSEMDEEIEVLEQKVEKAKGIKQGLMQVLLTGKIRLV